MARVSEISEASLPQPLRELYRKFTREYGDFTNQVRVVAHSPDAFLHLYGLIDAWRRTGTLSRRLVEIAVVTASRVNECSYCVGHHGAALIDLGIPAATVDRILDPAPPGLDEKERLVRDYARLVAERAWGIRDTVFEDLKRHFTDQQIVELTIRVGICILFNKLNQALGLDTEAGVEADVRARNIDLRWKANEDGR
jgi:uncharacterized peroxidase-related enzyme